MKKYQIKENVLVVDKSDKDYSLSMKDIETSDRPRERLIKGGPEGLCSQELLAIILGVGTKKEDVLAMSSRILKEYGEKNICNEKNPKTLEKELNISESKACQIVATFELGRRFFQKKNGRQTIIRNAKQVYNYLSDMREMPKEQLRGLYLNSRYQLVHDEVISVGTLTTNIVHPREVFRPAFEYSAVAVIIAHNHPSGNSKPTSEDIGITAQLVQAGKILGIDLLDHIVVSAKGFSSVPVDYFHGGISRDGIGSTSLPKSLSSLYRRESSISN